MKLMIFLLSLLFSFNVWARGPVDPISPPWPLSISIFPVDIAGLPGEWVAYEHNSVWFIDIESNANGRGLSSIYIYSNGMRTNRASGWLVVQENALVGQLIVDENHSNAIMIFRDRDGTKLRIAAAHGTYYDLKLYRKH